MRALTELIAILFLVGMIGAGRIAKPFHLFQRTSPFKLSRSGNRLGPATSLYLMPSSPIYRRKSLISGRSLAPTGVSSATEIDGLFVLAYPFIQGYQVHGFSDQSILPGGSIRFPLMFVDTGLTTPLGTTIVSGGGNLMFENIPKSTGGLFVDFFTPFSNLATSVAVPEPGSLLLAISRKHCLPADWCAVVNS